MCLRVDSVLHLLVGGFVLVFGGCFFRLLVAVWFAGFAVWLVGWCCFCGVGFCLSGLGCFWCGGCGCAVAACLGCFGWAGLLVGVLCWLIWFLVWGLLCMFGGLLFCGCLT